MLTKVDEPLVVIDGNNSLLSNCFNYTLMLIRVRDLNLSRRYFTHETIMRTRCYRDESERNAT